MSRNYVVAGVRVGRFISVVYNGKVVKGRVMRGGGRTKIYVHLTQSYAFVNDLRLCDEGITWCRDWTGVNADALRVAVGLR